MQDVLYHEGNLSPLQFLHELAWRTGRSETPDEATSPSAPIFPSVTRATMGLQVCNRDRSLTANQIAHHLLVKHPKLGPPPSNRAKGPTAMTNEALNLLVNEKHRIIAWCHLLHPDGNRGLLDALTLDASCQSRAPGLLNAAEIARAKLALTGDLEKFTTLAGQFLTDHANDLPPSKIRATEDVFGSSGPPSPDLKNLVRQIRDAVGDELFRHAGLCYTNAVNANIRYDEFGGLFNWTSDPIYMAEATTDSQGNSPAQVNHLYHLRASLGEFATSYISKLARDVASGEFQQSTLGDTVKTWVRLKDQIAESLYHTQSSAPQKEGRDIPLQSFLPQTLVTICNAYERKQCIITQHRRIKMTPRPSDQDQGPEFDYELTNMRAYRWVPNHNTGHFELQLTVPADDRHKLSMFLDCPSYYEKDAEGDGLSSSNDDTFFATLESPKIDIVWALFPTFVAHPPFTGYAKDKNPNHGQIYEQVCPPHLRQLEHSREWCEDFSFKDDDTDGPGESRASLNELILIASTIAEKYGIIDSEEYSREGINHCFKRRTKPIDTTVRHIKIKSFDEAVKCCEGYTARHTTNDLATFGSYVAGVGQAGISFRTKREGDEFAQSKYKAKALKAYKENYPNNGAFFPM